jgi:hypothetical protein
MYYHFFTAAFLGICFFFSFYLFWTAAFLMFGYLYKYRDSSPEEIADTDTNKKTDTNLNHTHTSSGSSKSISNTSTTSSDKPKKIPPSITELLEGNPLNEKSEATLLGHFSSTIAPYTSSSSYSSSSSSFNRTIVKVEPDSHVGELEPSTFISPSSVDPMSIKGSPQPQFESEQEAEPEPIDWSGIKLEHQHQPGDIVNYPSETSRQPPSVPSELKDESDYDLPSAAVSEGDAEFSQSTSLQMGEPDSPKVSYDAFELRHRNPHLE